MAGYRFKHDLPPVYRNFKPAFSRFATVSPSREAVSRAVFGQILLSRGFFGRSVAPWGRFRRTLTATRQARTTRVRQPRCRTCRLEDQVASNSSSRRRQDDYGAAGSTDPPLPHRRDGKPILSIPAQHQTGEEPDKSTRTKQKGKP